MYMIMRIWHVEENAQKHIPIPTPIQVGFMEELHLD